MTQFTFTYPAVVDSFHDGDTCYVHVRLSPQWELHGVHVRVDGINAPELSKAGGADALAYAKELCPVGTSVTLVSSRTEKYGRFLARVILPGGLDFGTAMIEAGHAVAYSP